MKRRLSDLTTRELQVAELIAWGASRKEVPSLLVSEFGADREISPETVRTILSNIYEKWQITKMTELSAIWFSLSYNVGPAPVRTRLMAALMLVVMMPSVAHHDDAYMLRGRTSVVRIVRTRTRTRECETYKIA